MAAAEVLGTLTSQKEPFSHADMSTIYSKSQWKFKITIELTFMDNIKTWKNTAKRMIDFLPVTWKCCFYSAHFQPGGIFDYIQLNRIDYKSMIIAYIWLNIIDDHWWYLTTYDWQKRWQLMIIDYRQLNIIDYKSMIIAYIWLNIIDDSW